MPVTAQFLKGIVSEARPIIERQMEDAKRIAGFRTVVSNAGGDWGALKALIKAQVEDENDETGAGKRVQKIRDKADCTSAYADMLGLANMNEKNFSSGKSYAEAKGTEKVSAAHHLSTTLKASNSKASGVDTFDTLHDPETGEITEQPETATQSDLTSEVRTEVSSSVHSDAGTLDQVASAPLESASDKISSTHSPSPVAAQVQQATADGTPTPVSSAPHSEDDDFDPSKLTFLKSEQRKSIADYREANQ